MCPKQYMGPMFATLSVMGGLANREEEDIYFTQINNNQHK